MTTERYALAYGRACSTTHERDNLLAVRPVFEAHLRQLARVEMYVQQLKSINSKEGETELWTYKIRQESSHMCNEDTVEEFYTTALAQCDGAVPILCLSAFCWKASSVLLNFKKKHC